MWINNNNGGLAQNPPPAQPFDDDGFDVFTFRLNHPDEMHQQQTSQAITNGISNGLNSHQHTNGSHNSSSSASSQSAAPNNHLVSATPRPAIGVSL